MKLSQLSNQNTYTPEEDPRGVKIEGAIPLTKCFKKCAKCTSIGNSVHRPLYAN